MAIHQTKKQSDLEKRLKLLRQQVYGKAQDNRSVVRGEKSHISALSALVVSAVEPVEGPHPTSHTDVSYLYQDLLKIGIFASVAIGVQIILFILSKNHILNLNFF